MSHNESIVAVYGGTFDPFHVGHQAICHAILAKQRVDQLIIVPCYLPALKADAQASAFHRLEMLEQWRAQQSLPARITIDPIEIERKGPSYTVDTINALKLSYPKSRLLFVLGADAWNSLPHWHQYEHLAAGVAFWVFTREGEGEPVLHQKIKQYTNFEQFVASSEAGFWLDTSVQLPISSSDIRTNRDLANRWLPASVSNYIKKVGLYQYEPVTFQEGNK